ncbi:MAG: aminoacyl-tRNA hydrolase [Candidatus Moranbacteria bacterium CG23_combo_of_CG06-09_8_20_14_all_35_22]|nr:MAG: aminoacyl-tRNA hydrolase [Candidatus Moranbacteria bacterium CG23_combo_of_CG06-09_8_20_14_all_35_22]
MKIIIGLGNPQIKYEFTRHNAGFFMLDKIQEKFNFPAFEFNKKFNSEISLASSPFGRGCRVLATGEGAGVEDNKILLIKPQTFMNLSGVSVKAILDFYKLSPGDIIVIHDDIDIPLGKYKIAVDSSSAGHNGVQNIIDQLGTQKFRRIRIGIGKTPEEKEACQISAHPPRARLDSTIKSKRVDERSSSRVEADSYVLEKFTSAELKTIKKISEDILEEIRKFLIL